MGIGSAIALIVDRVVDPVEGMHRVIADRWFNALGPLGTPLRWSHTAAASVVYKSIRLGSSVAGSGLDAFRVFEPSTEDAVFAWTSGLLGDGSDAMTARSPDGQPSGSHRDSGAVAPTATGRIVILVHGLVMTERSWQGTETRPGLARVLVGHPDLTPVAIRYNTGAPVADNGARLSDLVEELHAAWPVPVRSIALVGHSMGGLVIAEALEHGNGRRWIQQVTDVLSLGAPYRGAPLEKVVAAAAWGLALTRTTKPLSSFLDGRSRGVKDLGGRSNGKRDGVSPQHYRHHLVAGVITADPEHRLGALVGDLIVSRASSTRPHGLEPASRMVFGGVNHFDLLSDPRVIDHVMALLTAPSAV
jgi:pimeloyl-ACP methyl ester carboxylesterase